MEIIGAVKFCIFILSEIVYKWTNMPLFSFSTTLDECYILCIHTMPLFCIAFKIHPQVRYHCISSLLNFNGYLEFH